MLAGGVFPSLLHQDPRYFRKGTGSVYAEGLLCYVDHFPSEERQRQMDAYNYSNILGNLAAGGISNLYYPASDRGAALTVQRAFVVTAEGAIGSIFVEFWPDISTKFFKHHYERCYDPHVPSANGGLARTLSLFDAISIVVGSVIGSAIFLIPSTLLKANSSPLAAILVLLFAGVLSYFGALAYAELAGISRQREVSTCSCASPGGRCGDFSAVGRIF